MKKSIKIIICIGLVLITSIQIDAQSRKDLEKQRLQIIKDIEKTAKALEQTKLSKEKNLTQLKTLEQQMGSRKKLINNLQYEVVLNEKVIQENESTIQTLKDKYEKLKGQYSMLLRSSYLNKVSQSKWSYLLSAENLNRLVMRWRYIHQFDNFAKLKLIEIQNITGEIKQKNEEILKIKENNLSAIQETSKNVAVLEKEQKEKDAILKKLIKEEENLKSTLKKREKERENLNASIERIIIAELAKAKEKEKNDVKITRKKEIDNSGFANNMGSLNWPVENGKITGRFGTHAHPTLKNIEVSNNGVDFTLPATSSVSCVYDGDVVGVTTIQGFDLMVIIRHGSYYTVYSKLSNVLVSKGQKLKRGQKIGSVAANDLGVVEFHFELWKDKRKLDPEKWFSR
jgi:septal ring factor EnvC (AmiA/AmiB activator)